MSKTMMLLVLCAGLAGCSIYSPARDKQSQDLRAAYVKVDVKAPVAAARENRKKLLEQQIAVVEALSKSKAQDLAWAMATAEDTPQGDQGAVGYALDELAKTVGANEWTQAAVAAQQRALIATVNKEVARAKGPDFKRYGVPLPACEDVIADSKGYRQLKARAQAPKEFSDMMLQKALPGIETACSPVKSYQEAYKKAVKPVHIAKAEERLEQERSAVKRLSEEMAEAKTAVDDGLKSINQKKESCRNAAQPACLAELKALAADVAGKLEKFEGNAFVTDYLAEEKRLAIDEFLSFVSDYDPGKPIPDKSPRAGLVLVFFPELIDSVKQKSDGVEKSAWSVLAMQKGVAAIQSEVARKEIATRQQKIILLQQQIDFLWQRLDRFAAADALAGQLAPKTKTLELVKVLGSGSKLALNERTSIVKATAYYIDGATRLDAEAAKRELQLLALENEIALGYSEANINQWAVLVEANVASLEAAAKSGIRPETINALINSVFLLWIGAGVN